MIKYNKNLYSYKELFNIFVDLNKKEKLPSRILLTGQEGIGKFTFSLHFINYLFSVNEIAKYDLLNNSINTESISYKLINCAFSFFCILSFNI